MSEALGSHGKAGTEALIGILDMYFGRMLDIIKENNGYVIYFAGDGMLISFMDKTAGKKCSSEMMKAMGDFDNIPTPFGAFSLSMKTTGVIGSWNEIIVGNENAANIFIAGDAVKMIAEMEDSASSGEELWQTLKDKKDNSNDFTYNYSLPVKAYVPNDILKIAEKGQFGEHRAVSVIFLKVSGIDPASPDIPLLQQVVSEIGNIVERFGGALQLIDNISPGSFKVLITFGAPFSRPNDLINSLTAGKMIVKQLSYYSQITVKCGINQGYAFAGIIGNRDRKTYTLLGDAVNTAARLAQSAEKGGVYVSRDVKRLTEEYFSYREIEPIRVKGKSELLKRFEPLGKRDFKKYSTPYIERKEYENMINDFLSDLSNYVLYVIGEGGMGKTRTIHEVLKKQELEVFRYEASNDPGRGDLLKQLLLDITGMADQQDPQQKVESLASFISLQSAEEAERMSDLLPILYYYLLGRPLSGTVFEFLEPKAIRDNFIQAAQLILRNQRSVQAVWADNAHILNEDLLQEILDLLRLVNSFDGVPIKMMLSSRIISDQIPDGNNKVIFRPMRDAKAQEMAHAVLGNDVHKTIVDGIMKKTDGNPFFMEQTLSYLREKGFIELKEDIWTPAENYTEDLFPENIFSIVMSRLDALEERIKGTLIIASVMGIRFSGELLSRIDDKSVFDSLSEGEKNGIIHLEEVIEMEYIFEHAVFRDVIYDSILREKRKKMHRTIAKKMETLSRNKKADSSVLAYHFINAEYWKKAYKYCVSAGKAAGEQFLNQEAIRHFNQALEACDHGKITLVEGQRSSLFLELAQLYLNISDYENALKYFKLIEKTAPSNSINKIDAQISSASVFGLRGEFSRQRDMLEAVLKSIPDKIRGAAIAKAKIHSQMANLLRILGDIPRGLEEGKKAVKLLKGRSSKKCKLLLSASYKALGSVYISKGNIQAAFEAFTQAYRIGVLAQDLKGQCYSLNNIGAVLKFQGELNKSERVFQKSMKIARAIGDRRMWATIHSNLGAVYNGMERFDDALVNFNKCVDISNEIGNLKGLQAAYMNMGISYNFMKVQNRAEESYTKSIEISEALNYPAGVAKGNINLGLLYKNMNELGKARKALSEALEICEKVSDERSKGIALNNLGLIYLKECDHTNAEKCFFRYLENAEKVSDKNGICVAHEDLGELYLDTEDLEKAIFNLKAAEELSRQNGPRRRLAKTLFRLGYLLNDEQRFQEGVKILDETKAPDTELEYLRFLGAFQFKHGKTTEGIRTLRKGIKTADKFPEHIELKICLLFELTRNLKKSGDHDKEFIAAKKQLISESKKAGLDAAASYYKDFL